MACVFHLKPHLGWMGKYAWSRHIFWKFNLLGCLPLPPRIGSAPHPPQPLWLTHRVVSDPGLTLSEPPGAGVAAKTPGADKLSLLVLISAIFGKSDLKSGRPLLPTGQRLSLPPLHWAPKGHSLWLPARGRP
jgi:hypothetical protein